MQLHDISCEICKEDYQTPDPDASICDECFFALRVTEAELND